VRARARARGFPKTIINELLSAGYPSTVDGARHYPRFTRAPSEIYSDQPKIGEGAHTRAQERIRVRSKLEQAWYRLGSRQIRKHPSTLRHRRDRRGIGDRLDAPPCFTIGLGSHVDRRPFPDDRAGVSVGNAYGWALRLRSLTCDLKRYR